MADAPTLPERYRSAQFAVFDGVMPTEWMAHAGEWLYSQRGQFHRGGDAEGRERFNYELFDVDEIYQPFVALRSAVTERIDEVVKKVGVPDFDLDHVGTHATLYHHGSHATWHKEHDGTAKMAFALYMHIEPRMFSGGELEFLDGTVVEPKHNRLVMFDPSQQRRVRRVECWSADFLHGRWAIGGLIHGAPPLK